MRIPIHQTNSGNYNIAASNLASSRLGDMDWLRETKARENKSTCVIWEKRGGGCLQARERATNVMRGLLTSPYQSLKIQIKNSTLNGQKKLLLVKQTLILSVWEMIYPVDSVIQPLNLNWISTSFLMSLCDLHLILRSFLKLESTKRVL